MSRGEVMRTIRTEEFTIYVECHEDYDDLDLSWDEDGTTREGLESGLYVAFGCVARVEHHTLGEIGTASIWGCIYESWEQFAQPGQAYMRDIIREACQGARVQLRTMRAALNSGYIRA